MLKVKICGLRSSQDAIWANSLKPDYIGFVFAPSRRKIGVREASDISNALDTSIARVGVFVNPALSDIEEVLKAVRLDIIQLHGDETPSFCSDLPLPVWKAFRISSAESFNLIKEYESKVSAVVLDAFDESCYGGTGRSFEWHLAVGKISEIELVLSGGLNSTNLERACRIVKPEVVDVSGSVETDGFKDALKVAEFIRKARSLEGDVNI